MLYDARESLTLMLVIRIDVAKDSNAGLDTRATAAKDAVGDKVNETKHTVG